MSFFKTLAVLFVVGCLATPVFGQEKTKTFIDYFGLRKVSASQVDEALGREKGKELGLSLAEIRKKVAAIEGVEEVTVSPVQYPGTLAVFIGIRETGQVARQFRDPLAGELKLKEELLEGYNQTMKLLLPAIRSGKAGEDQSAGHGISEYEPMKKKQLELIGFANENFDHLVEVIHKSADDDSRAAAAHIIAYCDNKKSVVAPLRFACDDPHSGVRNNAVRALSVLASFAESKPEQGIGIDYGPFLGLLGSVVWTDRNKGTAVIDSLTKGRDEKLLATLAESHLPELTEMARWQSGGHAFFSIRILARIAGIDEDDIAKRSKACKTHKHRLAFVDEIVAKIFRAAGKNVGRSEEGMVDPK